MIQTGVTGQVYVKRGLIKSRMETYILIALVLTTCISLRAQDVIILENGGTMPRKEYEQIEKDKPRVIGYFDPRAEEIFYLKHSSDDEGGDYSWNKYSKDNAVEKTHEGEINMYENSYGCGSTKQPRKCTLYFLEKGEEYRLVYDSDGMDKEKKKEKIEFLKRLVADDPEILKEVEHEDFKLRGSDIEEVIINYNLRNFVIRKPATRTMSPIFFYVKNKLEDGPLELQVNDSLTYELTNAVGVSINLPATQVNKVCVGSGALRYCDFVSSTPYFIKYFEVRYRERAKVEFSRATSREAKRILDYYRGK